MAIESPRKHQKRTLFTLQHPRHFCQFSGGTQGRSRKPVMSDLCRFGARLSVDKRVEPLYLCRFSAQGSSELRAKKRDSARNAATFWSDALSSSGKPTSWGGVRFGTRLVDSRTTQVPVPPVLAFAPIRRIGGSNGWYFASFLWRIRGFFDLLVGGVGLRGGRRDPHTLVAGDALDFWRVESFEPDRRLSLVAEMKVPGRAWLQFEVEPNDRGSVIRQTAIFDPAGLGGLLYWYALYPIHYCIFQGMLHQIAAIAMREPAAASALA